MKWLSASGEVALKTRADGSVTAVYTILAEREKLTELSVSADKMQNILDRIENTDFRLTEYDDVMTRSFIERITVIDKHTIKIQFKGGYEAVQALD